MTARSVERILPASSTLEGGGFEVYRPFPGLVADWFDPFLLLDELAPNHVEPGEAIGAPPHSHPVAEGHTALIYAFAATTSTQSINRKLIDYACELLGDGLLADVSIETIDLDDYEMPIYSADRESAGGVPDLARNFYDKIGQADAVLVSFAEHNGFYTAAYKNIFDWASRIDMRVYQDKPVVLFSTSGGPGGGGNVLNTAVMSGQFFGYDVKASLSIPSFYENFDSAAGELTNPELDEQFRSALATLAGPVSAAA